VKVVVVVGLFCWTMLSIRAQEDYSENLWASISVKQQITDKNSVMLDGGMRTYAHFVLKPRVSFIRLTAENKLNNQHFLAVGYAFFGQFERKESWRLIPENRVFFQYRTEIATEQHELQLRVRNEVRYFSKKQEFKDRLRLQAVYKFRLKQWLTPFVSAEGFVTPGKNSLTEQRYAIGIQTSSNNCLKTVIAYTLQTQSNYRGIQNIISLQAQINLK
jgi:hypothetical protein